MKNKEKALAALLTCDTQREAAAMCGLTDRTLRLYLADPAFYAEYRRRKRQLVSEATKQLPGSYKSAPGHCRKRGKQRGRADQRGAGFT